MGEDGESSGDIVQSLKRGLSVVKAFGPEQPSLTLSEVARQTGLSRASARRFLLTLVDAGYVRFDGKAFSLRPRILELGYTYLSTLDITDVAAAHMEELVAEVRESSSVAVLDGDDIVYVARVPTSRIMTVTIAIGTRFPAYTTSMGRVLLAHLPDRDLEAYFDRVKLEGLTPRTVTDPNRLRNMLRAVRNQGYAIVDQELEIGLRSIAVPVRDRSGAVTAALNMSTHASRASLAEIRRGILPKLTETARRIEADLQMLVPRTGHRVPVRGPH